MKKVSLFLVLIVVLVSCSSTNEAEDKQAILDVMKFQETAWSNYDIDGFMEGYWKSDSLKFYGANGLTRGWQTTLDNYKQRYPNKDATGTLSFTIDDISKVSHDAYSVMGQFHLERPIGNANGVFVIIFKKINGEWKIVADMTC